MGGLCFQTLSATRLLTFFTFVLWCIVACRLQVNQARSLVDGPSKLSLFQSNDSTAATNMNVLEAADEVRRRLGYYGGGGVGGGGGSFNIIDRCWRGDSDWAEDRMTLAGCGIGFGSNAVGGKGGEYYVVTDEGDDAVDPAPGTLRYGAMQLTPLWIIFDRDMNIRLDNELIIMSDKTIDGRGANVHIGNGPCLTIQDVSNVIIHGLHISGCQPGKSGDVRSSTMHLGYREGSDGDAISILNSHIVWIDHNTFASCQDGLVDVIHGSTAITISNNAFSHHDKVMLLGHDDSYEADTNMRVTVAFNRFGPGLVQRMPRCRLGYFHIFNNDYVEWSMYAVGGSADPTIISENNRYQASDSVKEVTKRDCNEGPSYWGGWKWVSRGDLFLNGAFFVESGDGSSYRSPIHDSQQFEDFMASSSSSSFNPSMTSSAGALSCSRSRPCS
ncbi:hypothetical protein GOP47_0014263 [Adiantum capillus-veneris]|uniref:Pectate lyase n=1 Tax=Adiantum capillus-veneris TaxID=13818 RepID=A0A9D4ULA5_ADICA|nr:hypothetical protein GOP47_0014263 [Adiantum capillus-veneris]